MNAAPLLILAALASAPPPASAPESVDVPGFGKVAVRAPAGRPKHVVVFLTGVGGWDGDAEGLARGLAERGMLVLGVDTPRWGERVRKDRCFYPAGVLEEVAQGAEKVLSLPSYEHPVLVGHSLGASVAWAAVAEAPPGTFRGAVLVSMCPSLPLPRLCKGSGPAPRAAEGGDVVPPARIGAAVAVVSGADDRTCPVAAAEAFAHAVPGASWERLDGVGHSTDPAAPFADAVARAADRMEPSASPPPPPHAVPEGAPDVSDLPVVEVPAAKDGNRFAVMLTGDGGWVGLDKDVARTLSEAGVSVVGLDSLRYFWKHRKQDEAARDVGRIIQHYRAVWRRPDAILIGYSRGADIVPFLPSRMPEDARASLVLVAMLAPGTYAEFEVHVIDLFASLKRSDATSTEKAVRGSGGKIPMLCVQGASEKDSLCPRIVDLPFVKRVVLPGEHHFDHDYPKLARVILDAAGP
ncbi:AcvB/VirJ family lysyl-phosphatidylglycerol hydrolase [Anaeromyxobacter oryzae]|uniref:Virulence protein n=1 Tax=Anaeromyxobacter oryzae TaxID=2918170 RepID=A0ABM7X291_9BACT|nr:AcvB/VirJ family lysyl-phosphatidylglycerol hydrolase [Anaeromyxobacter oryzae]BDG05894.1 virulence protein [Anaeromyxobacter oryzae]